MLKTLFLFTMLNVLMGIQAQTEDLPLLKMKGSQFGIRNTLSPGIDYTKPDLRALMPNSTLLIQDLTDFRESGPSVNADNVDFEYLIKLSIKNKMGTYGNGRIRLGASLGYSYDFSGFINHSQNINLDSFFNSQSQFVSIDSFHSRSFSVQHSSNQFNLHFSYIMNSNPTEKINMFLGLGMNIGVLFNRSSYVIYSEFKVLTDRRTDTFNRVTQSSINYPFISISESFSEKSLFQLMPFVALGFNYQISLDHAFWKKVFVGYELRPSARFLNHRFMGKKKMAYANHGLTINYRI